MCACLSVSSHIFELARLPQVARATLVWLCRFSVRDERGGGGGGEREEEGGGGRERSREGGL